MRLLTTGSAGYSLVEVIVAMLISCIMVTAVMGVAVTGKQGSGKGMRRVMFDQGIAQVSAEVKQYVTACGCTKPAGATCPAPNCTQILGPNTNNAGVATWYLNGAPGAAGVIVDAGAVGGAGQAKWALSCGDHFITGVMNGGAVNLEAPPYNGYIKYNVTYPVSGNCAGLPTVTDTPSIIYTAIWTEP